jgi:pyrroloquinoline quinone (PQQ) biosynthesis protein C
MATKVKALQARLGNKLCKMANDVFKSRDVRHFLSVPVTRKRAAHYIFERSYFHLNRRQCWAYVQAMAPFDVKQRIWDHEEDELRGNAERGVENHWVLGMREGALVGLTPKDFEQPPSDGTLICTLAWARIASGSPWLEAVASSAVLEIANSDAIIKGGGIAHRFARKMARDIKIPIRKQPSNVEHIAVDIEHANLLFQVIKDHVKTREDEKLVLSGAAKGLAVNAAWLGFLAREMEVLR